MPRTEEHPASDQTGGAHSKTASETSASVPLGPDRVLVAGEWVDRDPDWRSRVDLGTAPRHVVYAAGMEDGYHLAVSELREFASLLADRLNLEQVFERAQRQVRRRVS